MKIRIKNAPEGVTDYRQLALTEAGKLPNASVKELLGRADEIEVWLERCDADTVRKSVALVQPKKKP